MRNNFRAFLVVIAVCACLAGIVSAAPAITFEPATLTLQEGTSAQVTLWLNEAPEGLAGYDMVVSLGNPGTSEIASVTYPSWGKLAKDPPVPNQSVVLSAVDVERQVQNGSARVELATITVHGISPGTTTVGIARANFDADGGNALIPAADTLTVTVPGAATPVPISTPANPVTVILAMVVLVMALAWDRRRKDT